MQSSRFVYTICKDKGYRFIFVKTDKRVVSEIYSGEDVTKKTLGIQMLGQFNSQTIKVP